MPRRDYDDDYDDRDDDRYDRGDDRGPRRRPRYDDDYDDDYEFGQRRYREEHRGTLILVLGICGLVVCGLCAPIAWVLGSQDLAKMRAGTMDYSGYGSTQAGYVLGVIGTVLILLAIAFFCVVFGLIGVKGR